MPVPAKPKRMSDKQYRQLYDSDPQYVEFDGHWIKTAGRVSAEVIAKTYRAKGHNVTIRPVDDPDF